MTPMEIFSLLSHKLPMRKESANKGDFGKLSVVAGSERYRGAASLAVNAALRCGVGLVRLVSTEPVIAAVAATRPECTFFLLAAARNGGISQTDFLKHLSELSSSDAILVGCGMTVSSDTEAIVSALSEIGCPLVIDADGLNALRYAPERLKGAVITPHVGEMARLTGLPILEIQSDREKIARRFSQDYGCVTVLKDSVTAVASPDGDFFVWERENSGLAKGGSGDVLAGVIASLLAQGLSSYDAAVCGVVLHGLAAGKARERLGAEAMLPTDVIASLSTVYQDLRKESLS